MLKSVLSNILSPPLDNPHPFSLLFSALAAILRAGGTLLLPGAATPILGPELVTNGTFDTATDWALSAGGGSSAITGGSLVLSGPTSSYPSAQQDILTAGKRYQITFTTTTAIASGALGVRIGGVASSSLTQVTAAGTYTIEGVADGPSLRPMRLSGFSDTVNITSISAKEVTGYTYGNPPVRNYLDSAGTDILDSVTQVDQPVGLVLDGAGSVGPERILVNNAALTGATGWTAVDSQIVPASLSYVITYQLAQSSGGVTISFAGSTVATHSGAVSGTFRVQSTPSASGKLLVYSSASVGSISSVSVREIPGNHATQPTTGSKPTLRRGLVNQLLWSNDLNQRTAKTNVNISGVSLIPTVTSGVHAVTDVVVSVGQVVTYAFRAKANGYRYLGISNAGAAAYTATFDLVAGVCTVGGSITAADMVLQADGYYICRASFVAAYTTVGLYLSNTYVTNISNWAGDGNSGYFVDGIGLFQGTVTVQQILAAGGIPLTTTAPASSALGNYWWQFDPTAPGDFLQTAITTGNDGWICAGFKTSAVGAQAMLSSGATSAIVAGAMLRLDGSNSPQILVGNGTTREFVSDFSGSVPIGTPFVIEGGWNASSMFCAVNGSAGASLAKTVNCTTTNTFNVGATAGGVFAANGAMPAIVICPTLPPPADRALIRKWVGSLQGQTL